MFSSIVWRIERADGGRSAVRGNPTPTPQQTLGPAEGLPGSLSAWISES